MSLPKPSNVTDGLNDHQRIEKELGLNSFFFDKVGLYLSLLAVVLIGLDTTANLLPGGADLKCFIPKNASATKEQSDFVNAYCDNQLPNTKFSGFTVFLQSFITTALYLLWDAYKNYYVHKYAENTQEKVDAVSHLADAVLQLAAPVSQQADASQQAAAVSKKAAPESLLANAVSKLAVSQLANAVSQLANAVSKLAAPVPLQSSQHVSPVSRLANAVSKLADALSNLAAPIAAPVSQLVAPVSQLADVVSKLAAVPQLDAPVSQLDAPVSQLDAPVSQLADALFQLAASISQQNDRSSQHNGNGCCTKYMYKYSLMCSYWIKHLSQLAVVKTGVIVMLWELHWTPFTFDKTFLCYINFDDTWSLSCVQCDYTSVALSPIFLATYFTISACILFAGIFALCSIHNRNMCCTRLIDNNDFMRLIAVGDTAERAYKKLHELKPLQ